MGAPWGRGLGRGTMPVAVRGYAGAGWLTRLFQASPFLGGSHQVAKCAAKWVLRLPHSPAHPPTQPFAASVLPPAGLAWTAVEENPKLKEFFDVLSLSADRGGQVYVSTFEGRQYPITGTQW